MGTCRCPGLKPMDNTKGSQGGDETPDLRKMHTCLPSVSDDKGKFANEQALNTTPFLLDLKQGNTRDTPLVRL